MFEGPFKDGLAGPRVGVADCPCRAFPGDKAPNPILRFLIANRAGATVFEVSFHNSEDVLPAFNGACLGLPLSDPSLEELRRRLTRIPAFKFWKSLAVLVRAIVAS